MSYEATLFDQPEDTPRRSNPDQELSGPEQVALVAAFRNGQPGLEPTPYQLDDLLVWGAAMKQWIALFHELMRGQAILLHEGSDGLVIQSTNGERRVRAPSVPRRVTLESDDAT